MKRWLASAFIVSYLSVLMFGLTCHTLSVGVSSHPAMYWIVWDMFCGWATYASQVHILAEGESGKYYELAPGPWGGFSPWADKIDRANYDVYGTHCARIAMNTLNHSKHEPISRMFIVEESWSKKYDLPPAIWQSRFDEPQQKQTYCRVVVELCGEGNVLRTYQNFLAYQNHLAVASNPRLQEEAQRYTPMYIVNPGQNSRGRDLTVPTDGPMAGIPFGVQAGTEGVSGIGGVPGVMNGN